jgi:hypothetical protein
MSAISSFPSLLGKRPFSEVLSGDVPCDRGAQEPRAKKACLRAQVIEPSPSKPKKIVRFHDKIRAIMPICSGIGPKGVLKFELKTNFTDRVSEDCLMCFKRYSYERINWPTNEKDELGHVISFRGYKFDSRPLLKSVTLKDLLELYFPSLCIVYPPLSIHPSLDQVHDAISNHIVCLANSLYGASDKAEELFWFARKPIAIAFSELVLFRDHLDVSTKEKLDLKALKKGCMQLLKMRNEKTELLTRNIFADFLKVGSLEAKKIREGGILMMNLAKSEKQDLHQQTEAYISWMQASSPPKEKVVLQDIAQASMVGVPRDVLQAEEFKSLFKSFHDKSWLDGEEKVLTCKNFEDHQWAFIDNLMEHLLKDKTFQDFLWAWKGLK